MFEIGSEFWTENHFCGTGIAEYLPKEFDTRFTLCGRTALDIIIEDLIRDNRIFKVYMPSYCCHTMIEPFKAHGIDVKFYDVFPGNTGIDADFMENDCDTVFLIDYFGYLNEKTIKFAKSEKSKGKTIIYDKTHSLFCYFDDWSSFDYIFGSFKKWLGVNAGFVSKNIEWIDFPVLRQNEKFIGLRKNAFDLKADFISNPDDIDKSVFLRWFGEAEDVLERDYKYYGPDDGSIIILTNLDANLIRQKRIENAKTLLDGLTGIDGVRVLYKDINRVECPLFVPICVEERRDELRKYLISNGIYMPVHWPVSSFHHINQSNCMLFDAELSCVCDQRYCSEDMYRIVEKIRRFFTGI